MKCLFPDKFLSYWKHAIEKKNWKDTEKILNIEKNWKNI